MPPIQTLSITSAEETALPNVTTLPTGTVPSSTPGFVITLMPNDPKTELGFRLTLQGSIAQAQFAALFPVGTTFYVEEIAPTG